MPVKIGPKDALIIVDVQRDFIPGGTLPVPEGDRVVPILNDYKDRFLEAGALICATRDWHPRNHISFKEQGGIWPPHCVQNTQGADFHPALEIPDQARVISKGTEPGQEAYSGFQGTELEESLRRQGVERVFIGGLATDYCVKETVLDAIRLGFRTFILEDAVKGVDVNPGDSERALKEMVGAGAVKVRVLDISI
ncbi:MAG TPA: nicotinamidase [Candidatus Latescibacteria bacterium]|nr:nicotinamidase [Candidatus Latescibacterota bacterium]